MENTSLSLSKNTEIDKEMAPLNNISNSYLDAQNITPPHSINRTDLSIVVPLYNEEGNVAKLHASILEACQKLNKSFEIIFVNDGSDDRTEEICETLKPLLLLSFRKNFGQTAALDAGIKIARGKIIVTMDGDLQNDPADIGKLLAKLDEGYDAVSGWRKNRHDPWSKKFFSRGADWLRKFLIDDKINDSGCTLKAYKRECFTNIDLFGEIHRFIPAVLKIQGFKIGEVVVKHRPRIAGATKYNYKRVIKGFLDMVSVWFWRKYATRPLHLFGSLGILFCFIGILILVWMAYERIVLSIPIGNRIWPLISIFFILVGIQLFISGLLADIAIKTYYKTRREQHYSIREIVENK